MTSLKIRLLTATTLVAISATANAQTVLPVLPNAELRGAGATAVGPITTTFLNCIGQPNADAAGNPVTLPTGLWYYGTNSNQQLTQTPGNYTPATPSATNPGFNCATEEVQPNFEGKYVGTGSGTGRNWWSRFSNQLPGTGTSGTNINPFAPVGTTQWTNVQYAFSEGPISTTDLTTYNTNAAPTAGAPIQVPFYVVPVALAYSPKYGVDTSTSTDLNFNVKVPVKATINGVTTVVGGLRLNRDLYCRIFNGQITNWNHADIQRLNGGSATNAGLPLGAAADVTSGRWASEGAPIRLVGRLDSSGTTDIFTRHLAAVCPGVASTNALDTNANNDFTNKFIRAGDSLPYASSSTINLTSFLSTTRYFPGNTSSSLAGSIQSISGAVFDRVAGTINTTQGAEAAGLFMVADGSSGVEAAVRAEGANLNTSTVNANIKLNGKLGYISADWVIPAPSRTLHSAALPQGLSTTVFKVPNALEGGKAVGTLLPPQTIATSGAFNTTDARTSNLGGTLLRSRPQDWSQALYPNSLTGLAAPTGGYAITGVSYLLTYTCFNTTAKRLAVANVLGVATGKVTKLTAVKVVGGTNTATLNANTFRGTGGTSFGIFAQLGIGIVPAAWQNAIAETFTKRSTQASGGTTLGALNLWIQDRAPAKATDFDGTVGAGNIEILSNPSCTANTGA